MRVRDAWLLTPLVFGACKVVDAPGSLEELVVYGFVHFDEDNPNFLRETVPPLLDGADANIEELEEGYRVEDLTQEDLAAAGVEGADITGIVGALGAITYHSRLDDVVKIVSHEHKDNLFEKTLSYDVTAQDDRACFLAHECERFEQTIDETTKVPLLGEATRTFVQQFRWVTIDDEDLVVIRSLSPDPIEFNSNIAKVHQQYSFVVIHADGKKKSQRIETFWVDAEIIGLDVPDNYAVNNAVKGMADQGERIDEIIAGG